MNNLINIKNENGKLTVTSRQIAENFEKEHNDTKKKIRELIKDMGKISHTYFVITDYVDSMNRPQEEYLITRDGFTLLVMGFTGTKALDWKLKYIQAFNKMEQSIKSGQTLLSPKEQLKLQLQVLEEQDKKIEVVSERLTKVENTMTIDYSQQEELRNIANRKVIATLGGKDAPAYKECSKKAFSELWKAFKRVMQVNSYRNTSVKEYDYAKKIIKIWEPNRDLELMILGANSQIKINL